VNVAHEASLSHPDPLERLNCSLLKYAASGPVLDNLLLNNPDFDWDEYYGADAKNLLAIIAQYDYRAHHDFILRTYNSDWLIAQPIVCIPLMEHWVNVEATDELIPKLFANFGLILQEPDVALEHASIMWGSWSWATFLYSADMTHWYADAAALMAQAGLTYKTAHATLDTCLTPWVRKRGDTTMNVHFTTAEFWAWEAQMAYVLVSSDPGVSAKEILAALPTVEDIVRCTITYDELSQTHAICYGHGSNLF
jgi:hypothetical protein